MESYLGSPIRIGGEICGTFCLLDAEPREEPFAARDFEKLRLLVERTEAILDFHEEEVRLDGVLQRLSATRGQDFFGTFAQSLAQALEVRYVFIGEFIDGTKRLRSIAWWDESKLGKQLVYDLAGSPCENLSAGEFFRCTAGIRNLFPDDQLVRRFCGESYLGIPIVAEDECRGYVVALDRGPMRTRWFRDRILGVLAQLAGSEMLRSRTQQELQHAQKIEAIGQLTGGVAHDFNNLLAVICGNLELLSEDIGDENVEIDEISKAVSRGADLTQRLLAFARQQPLNATPSDIRRLVLDMNELIERTLGAAIEVKTKVHDGPAVALVDQGQAENAILNLAINSRDAMPDGGSLFVETALLSAEDVRRLCGSMCGSECDARPSLVISVRDTGIGMSEEVLSRAFDPFFTTKPKGDGSGLGLSMVYGFAKQSGGFAIVESELGVGTTVKLLLPQASDAARSSSRGKEMVAPPGQGETVLAVEDDPAVRRYLARSLEKLGYNVLEAGDVVAARAVLKSRDVDVLLSDVLLPGGANGLDLAKEAQAELSDLSVILISGYPSELKPGELDSSVQFLSKPFSRVELASALHRALQQRQKASSSDDENGRSE